MEKRVLTLSAAVTAAAAAVFLFLKWQVSVGLICGVACFRLYFMLLEDQFDSMLQSGEKKGLGIGLSALLRMAVLVAPLLAAMLLPDVINVWGVFAGLMAFKVFMYGSAIFQKKEKLNEL